MNRAQRGLLCLVLAWWFLFTDFSTPYTSAGRSAIGGFRWWTDCEETRAYLERQNSYFTTSKCMEGEPPSTPTVIFRNR